MSDVLMLDTDTASYVIKGSARALDSYLRAHDGWQVCISAVTRAELRFGALRNATNKHLAAEVEAFLSGIHALSWDDVAADQFAEVRFNLERVGTPIGPMDTMIAAHAKSLGAILVTNNTKHFRLVKGLKLQNWAR
jgi:tRNA(fMet)-specific endonuclease VapC